MLQAIYSSKGTILIVRTVYSVCVLFCLTLILVAIYALAKTMGGTLSAFIVALGLIGSITILVGYVVYVARFVPHADQPYPTLVETSHRKSA
jgi:hypothetical protein